MSSLPATNHPVLQLLRGGPAPTRSAGAELGFARADDPPIAAFHATGLRRVLLLTAWSALVLCTFGCLAWTAWHHPTWLLAGLVLAYLAENLLFVLGHVGLHAAFIELPEGEMATITHHSFLHHYRQLRTYHQTWLESRLSYFFCPRKGLRSISTWAYLVPQLATAAAVALVEPAAGVALLGCVWAARLLQSVVHEWYHHDDRASFYWVPTRLLLESLEALGLLSTQRHRRHHAHHLHNLDAVHHWTDMRVPGLDRLGDRLWARLCQRHVAGQRHMVTAAARLVTAWAPVHYGGLAVAFVALARLA